MTVLLVEGEPAQDILPLALRARGRPLYYLDLNDQALADLDKVLALPPG
jgi:hypothetical protein